MTALARLLGLALLLPAVAASADTAATIRPGWRPPTDSDEGGLWMLADRAEASLRTSGLVVADAGVTAHVAAVACRVAGPHCGDVRVHVIRAARANATMAPNGALVVSTGLLLRTASEAQLAYVLGHEIGHYERRHGVRRWRDQANRAAAGHLLGPLGLQSLAFLGTGLFSREQESEADALALRLMVRAGYDPQQAVAFLEAWLAAEQAAPPEHRGGVLASHPLTADRLAAARAATAQARPSESPTAGAEVDAHRRALAPLLGELLQDQLRLREFAVSLDLAERLLAAGVDPGAVHYFRGEVYRRRGEAGDVAAALAALEAARATGRAPAAVHRALGLLHMKLANADQARACFTRYLEERPDAEDRAMVESYLVRLEGGQLMRRLSGLLVLVLVTAGCSAYRLVEPPRASVGRLSVDPQVRWSALEQGRLTLWTIDGLSLQRILFLQAAEGEALSPVRGTQPKVVRAGLTPDEAMDLVVDVLVADFGVRGLETRNRRLRPFAQAEGFAFDFAFLHQNGLDQEGTAAGAVIGRRLYVIVYSGARTHYFAQHREAVERMIDSVRIE